MSVSVYHKQTHKVTFRELLILPPPKKKVVCKSLYTPALSLQMCVVLIRWPIIERNTQQIQNFTQTGEQFVAWNALDTIICRWLTDCLWQLLRNWTRKASYPVSLPHPPHPLLPHSGGNKQHVIETGPWRNKKTKRWQEGILIISFFFVKKGSLFRDC